MQEQTIVSVLGLALLFWWATSGRTKVNSIGQDVAMIKRLSEPWTQRDVSHKQDSAVWTNLTAFVSDSEHVLEDVTETFQTMTQSQLSRYIQHTLPNIVERVVNFRMIMQRAQWRINKKEKFVDGPFQLETQNEIDDIQEITNLLIVVYTQARDLGVEILIQLDVPVDVIKDMALKLDVFLDD